MKFINIFNSIFLGYFLLINCRGGIQSTKPFYKDSIIAITVASDFPLLDNKTGKFLGYAPEDSASIFYYKNFILHKVPYNFYVHKLSDSGIYEIDKVEKRTKYLIYQKGDSLGFFIDSSISSNFVKCKVDSFLSKQWHMQPFLDPVIDKFHYRLIDSLTNHSGRFYYNTYFFQNKADSLQKGTFTLEFSDSFPAISYSICHTLDTIKGKKLTNITIFNEKRYVKDYNITIDAVKQYERLILVKNFKMAEITPYFEYVKKKSTEN